MNDELRSLGSVRARGIILLVAVGVAGGMAGGALDRLWVVRHDVKSPALIPGSGEERRPGRSREERRGPQREGSAELPAWLRSVDLSGEQRNRIVAITAKFRPAADSLMRSVLPRVMELNLRMSEEAMCVLTPRQREDWIAWRRREHLSIEEANQFMRLVSSNSCPK
ncbi:MAG TPA: hypothetical protein VHE78_16155 [Gemmatimonadaceae bacterium]|nr:hypothetical protein [Gemmatimonadaceae bacterium]